MTIPTLKKNTVTEPILISLSHLSYNIYIYAKYNRDTNKFV